MTKSKRIQEDSEEKKGPSLKSTDDILTKEDQEPEKIKVLTDGNSIPKNKRDKWDEILTSHEISIAFPQRIKNDYCDMQFRKFLKVLSKVHIHLSFTKAISKCNLMPSI